MALVQLPVSTARARLTQLVTGSDIVQITQRGKVVATLYPEGTPRDQGEEAVERTAKIVRRPPDPPLELEVDDWDLPITESIEKPAGMELGTSKKPTVPIEHVKTKRDNFAEAGGGQPKYRRPSGLSKSAQAKGNYER